MTQRSLGFDIGGTKIAVARVDGEWSTRPADLERAATPIEQVATPQDPHELVAVIAESVARHCDGETVSIGVGFPGSIGPDNTVTHAPNLPQTLGLDIKSMLQHAVRASAAVEDVVVGNDANCAAVAMQAVFGADDLITVTLGTGIGGGLIVGGQLVQGNAGAAGEIGHIIVDAHGRACACGQRGCWEQYASGTAFTELLAQHVGGTPGPNEFRDFVEGCEAQQPWAIQIANTFAEWLAVGLASLINVLDPPLIALSGSVTRSWSAIGPVVHTKLHEIDQRGRFAHTELGLSPLGSATGAIGAALLCSRDERRR